MRLPKISKKNVFLLCTVGALVLGGFIFWKYKQATDVRTTRVTVYNFPTGAVVKRSGSPLSGVHRGTLLLPGDVLNGSTRGDFDIQMEGLAVVRIKPNAQITLQTLIQNLEGSPTRVQILLKLDKGTGMTRLHHLTGQSSFILETPGVVTAARGTAFRVQTKGQSNTDVLVAEGRVGVSLQNAPGRELLIGARQKSVVRVPVPNVPVATTRADEPTIRELLNLPLPPVVAQITNAGTVDVADVVVTGVLSRDQFIQLRMQQIRRKDPNLRYVVDWSGSGYFVRWVTGIRNIVTMQRTEFYSTDNNGVWRHVGENMFFEGMSPDGKTLYGSRPNSSLYAMNFDGTNLRKITSRQVNCCRFSPDGKRVIVNIGWYYDTKYKYWRAMSRNPHRSLKDNQSYAIMNADGSNFKQFDDYQSLIWSPDGNHILVQKDGKSGILNADGSGFQLALDKDTTKDTTRDRTVFTRKVTVTHQKKLKSGLEITVADEYPAWFLGYSDEDRAATQLNTQDDPWEQCGLFPDKQLIAYTKARSGLLGFVSAEHPVDRVLTSIVTTGNSVEWTEDSNGLTYGNLLNIRIRNPEQKVILLGVKKPNFVELTIRAVVRYLYNNKIAYAVVGGVLSLALLFLFILRLAARRPSKPPHRPGDGPRIIRGGNRR